MADPKPRILAADDEAPIREIIKYILEGAGYEVMLAKNGEDAVAQATGHLPDLVILDVTMPGLDGYETCKRIRSVPNIASVPVLFLTARKGPKHWTEASKSGGDAYLEKPFRNETLLALVREILGRDSESKKK